MNQHKILIFSLIVIGFSSCNISGQQPDNTKPMYGEAVKNERYKKSDEDFKKQCIAQYGSLDSAVQELTDFAWRYFYHHDLTAAMKRFNQAWLLNPEFPDPYFGFAALMDMQGNTTEADRFYKTAQEKDAAKERAKICYRRIADCKEQLKDFKGTVDAYRKLAEIDPGSAFAFKKMGYFYMQFENFEEALTAYTKAIELDPADAMTYNNRAYLYQTAKKYEKAIADYTKAIELDPQFISAYANRGMTLMEEFELEAAKKDFEVCVQLESNSGELRRILGLCKLALNDKAGACGDFATAKKLGDVIANDLIKQNCE